MQSNDSIIASNLLQSAQKTARLAAIIQYCELHATRQIKTNA